MKKGIGKTRPELRPCLTSMTQRNTYLNLGCGARFHPGWTNVDVTPRDEGVIAHDLRSAVPFPEKSFDVVYHSHLLEHLPRNEAPAFLAECYRVLKPGGVLRVVVPDLEQIARLYLQALQASLDGDRQWQSHYRWMMLEMYDQTVRDRSGGEMAAYLGDEGIPNRSFVLDRMGAEGRQIMASAGQQRVAGNGKGDEVRHRTSWSNPRRLLRGVRFAVRSPRKWLLRMLLGNANQALRIGEFRLAGEVHQWMYDRYSLSELLKQAGFASPKQVQADESAVPNWTSYGLDVEPDGSIYKPDSLFMEATRPANAGQKGIDTRVGGGWTSARQTRCPAA
jgi:predicted SAM-dependent methyltransferase